MTANTNVPYWVVASRVGCVLSQVIAASRDLPLKLSFTPNIVVHLPYFTNNGLSLAHVKPGNKFAKVRYTANTFKRAFGVVLYI